MKKRFVLLCVLALAICAATVTRAAVTITTASGGTSISADKAQNGAAPAFTTLGDIVILEGATADIGSGTSRTLILTAPSGWQFNPGVGTATAAKISTGGGGNEIVINSLTVTATNLTVNFNVSGTTQTNSITISGLQARATEGGNVPASGNILRTAANPGIATISGVTNDSTSFGALSQAVGALRLYMILPGQTFSDASTVFGSGIAGTPTAQTAGTAFNITVILAADRQFNIDGSYGAAKTISYSGPGGTPSYTTAVNFSGGQSTTTLATTLNKAETTTITATDGTVTGVASSNLTVNAGAFAKLQLLVPGETAAAGTLSGKAGTPDAQTKDAAFNVIVNAVDANWNFVSSTTDTIGISSSDGSATLPPNAALISGTKTFSVTLRTLGAQTLTASDISDISKAADTSPPIAVQNPGTTTALISSANPSCLGQSVTFTATVTVNPPNTGTPTGTVDFKDGATIIDTETLNGSGQASFSTSSLASGAHSITAVYSGDADFNGSTSLVLTQTVNTPPTITINPTNSGGCVGSSISFNSAASGSPAPSIQWQASGDGGLNFTNVAGATNTTLTFTAALSDNAKQYRAIFTNVCGTTTSSNATLTVNALPVCGITGADRACTNTTGNIYLGPDSMTGYLWSISGNGTISGATNAQSVNVTAGSSSTFTLTLSITNASGCASTCSKTVTNVPKPTATVSGGGPICSGNSTNIQAALTGTGPWTVAWSDGVTQTNVAVSPVTRSVNPTSTTIYTVTSVTDANCSNAGTGSATVTVNTAPQITLNPLDTTSCVSNSITFTATASGSPAPAVQWQISTNGGLSFSNITGQTSTTYTFTNILADNGKQYRARFTNSCGTVFSTAATLTVNAKPTATVSGGGTICFGNSTNIQAALTGTGPWTVAWSDGVTQASVAVSPATRTVSPFSTTVYTVTNIIDANCSNTGTGSATVTVNTAPIVSTNPTNRSACVGNSVSFTATASGSPAPSIQWQASGDGGSNFTNVPGATSTTYTFTAIAADDGKQYHAVFSNQCGTAISSNATLTLTALPNCSITGADNLCANSVGNMYQGPASLSGYRWSISGNGSIVGATNTQSVSITAGATSTFTLTLTTTNASDCTSTCSKIVTNVPRPTATVSGGGTICSGNSTNIQAAVTGTGPWTVAWSDGVTQTNVAVSPTTRSVSPSATTVYTVTNIVDANCSNTGTGSATVTVNTAPQVTSDIVNTAACVSNSVTFIAVASGSPAPAVQWQVSTNGGASFTNIIGQASTNYTFTAVLSDNNKQYRARFTNSCGTVFSTVAILTVNPNPTATASGSATICAGNSTAIQAVLTGAAPWTVVWSDGVTNNNVLSSPLTRSVSPAATTTYTVSSVSDTNCTGTASGSAIITINTPPSVATNPTNRTVCAGSSVSFTSTASGTPAPTIQWQASGNGGTIFTNVSGATSTTLTFTTSPADNGKQYRAQFTNSCGGATSTVATLTVNALPDCSISGADRLCTNTTGNVYLGPVGLAGYRWSISGNGTINGVTNAQSVNVTAGVTNNFTLTLTTTNASGCTSTCNKTVTNVPKPTATVSGGGTICAGGSTNIQAALTGTGPWTVAWSDGVTQTNLAVSPAMRTVSPSSTTTYTVTSVTGDCSNAGTGSATVTVNTPSVVTSNPTNRTVCAGSSVSFISAASGSPTPSVQWQASGDGGSNFTNITGATSSTYTFTAALNDNGKQYRARFTNSCGTVFSSAATLTVNPTPDATILGEASACASSTGNPASVLDAGAGATYSWTITGGTITAGAGTTSITFTAGASGSVQLGVTVSNTFGCSASGNKTVSIVSGTGSEALDAWITLPSPQWQSSTLNNGDHIYAEGNSIPFRLQLNQLCAGGSWCVVLQYSFKDGNTPRHFFDFLTTYNSSEPTVGGHECDNKNCTSGPNTFPIPLDTNSASPNNISYQIPGNFTVYNGNITNVSDYTTVSGSTILKQLTLSGTIAAGGGAKDVLILFGGHLAREVEWGPANGASSFPGASAKLYFKFCGGSSFNNLSFNPGGIIKQADLAITKGDSPDPICAGNDLTYTLLITNSGPNLADPVTVLDNLPAGTTLVSATPSQGTFTGTTSLNFALGTVNAASNATITIVVRVNTNAPAGTYTNTATISATAPEDPNTVDNSATATTTVFARTTATPLSNPAGCQGFHATFSTTASGTGPFTYQWTRNGTNIAGATTNSYSIASVQTSDTANYCVIVTGTCNSVTNCASLTVSTNAATSPLVDLTKCPGENATFSTTPSGSGPFTIFWRKDGVLVPGATNTSFTITNVSATNAGSYCVEVTGTCNATNNCATLTVRTNTTVGPLTEVTNCIGATATFTAAASGTGPFSYIWRKESVELTGETNSILILNNVSTNDAGNYCVEVTGACNSATNCAALTVNAPNTADALVSLTNCPGATVTFSTVAHGTGPFRYQWFKDAAPLAVETNSSITLSNISSADAGTYSIEVIGACNGVTNVATLTVLTNASATDLASLTNCPGAPALFSTIASGTGPFSYQWTKNGSSINGATNDAFAIAAVQPGDAGSYCVEVTGLCTSVTNCASLTVLTNTSATPLTSLTNCPGTPVSFSTIASGTGPFSYQWTRDGAAIMDATNSSYAIAAVQDSDAGTYCIEVTGSCTSVTNCATLTVLTNISATQPTSLTNCPGAPASFSTVASGTGPFSYQWTKDGALLSGATNSSYSIAFVQASDAGTYCIEVTGFCTSVTNCASLTVLTNTSATPLTSLTNCPGTPALFNTIASGTGPFTYQWTRNSSPINGATNSSYSIAGVQASDAGGYCVAVTGLCTSVTNCATLTVLTNTSASALTSLTNCPGTPASFSTIASGTGPFAYQWTRNGASITDATNSSYSIASVQASDAAQYCVQVTGLCNSVTNCASLTVLTNTTADPLISQTNCPGSTVTFSTVAHGTGPFTYQWLKAGAVLTGQTNNSLMLVGINSAFAGDYCVEVRGLCTSVTNCATLTVLTNTSATQPTSLTNCPGTPASFNTIASGTGPFTYQWIKNSSPINGATNSSYSIPSAQASDAAQYCVQVGGFCTSVTNCATLTVLTNTSATQPISLTNCPGTPASFSTIASGTGPFTYQWTRNSSQINGATNSSYSIASVQASDAANYCVQVTGFCTSVTNCATLTVLTNTGATPLTSLTNCPGTPASFSTIASGTGPFSYQWTRNGAAINSATNSSYSIASVQASDAAQYCVQVTGLCTSVTNCASLTVKTNTSASPLTDLVLCPGQTANFSTIASGTGPFIYRWTRDGGALASQTNSSLSITNISAANAGLYCVEVTGNCTSVTNCGRLTVNTNVTADALISQTNCPGATVTFSTVAHGTGPFTYQWLKDSFVLNGQTNNSLTLFSINSAFTGTYSVRVSGLCSSVTNSATLTVLNNTTASTPGSLTLCPGQTAAFSTLASGTGPFTYQWTKNGTNLSGVTSSSYSIASVAAKDAGTYCVVVGGLCNGVTNCATLQIITPGIVVTKICPSNAVPPGGLLVFSGTVSNAGGVTLTNVTVVDNRPTNNSPVIGPITLLPGQFTNFTGSYTVPDDQCGPCVDTLTARGNTVCTGSNITATATTACPVSTTPGVAVTASCPPTATSLGTPLIFSGTVSNAGNVTLTNVIVVVNQPANNTPVFGPITLAKGETAFFVGGYIPPVDSCLPTSTATITALANNNCTGSNVTASVTNTCPVTTTPRLSLTKICPSPVPPGGLLNFSGSVSNSGNITITNIFVVNDQPSNNTPVIGPLTLAPGQSTNFAGSYRVCPECCPPYVDTLTATGKSRCNGSNVTASATAVCPGITTPRLTVTKNCPAQPVTLGQLLVFSGTVSNAGDVALSNILVTDNKAGTLAQLSALAPGESFGYLASYTPTNCGPSVTSTVTASATDACTGTPISTNLTTGCNVICSQTSVTIINPRIIGDLFAFSFATQTGHLYTVQFTPVLPATNWQVLTNIPGTGSILTIQDPKSQTQRYYRVWVQ